VWPNGPLPLNFLILTETSSYATVSGSYIGEKSIYEVILYHRNLCIKEQDSVDKILHTVYSLIKNWIVIDSLLGKYFL